MISCSPYSSPSEVYTTDVVKADMQSYGNYVYTYFGSIYRCDRVTNEFLKACVDPECDGKCPIDGAIAETDHIENGKLFFHSFEVRIIIRSCYPADKEFWHFKTVFSQPGINFIP